MSKLRGLFPALLATGFGVLNGYVIFKPAYEDLDAKKLQKLQESQSNELGPDLKDVPIADTDSTSAATPSNHDGAIPPKTWTRTVWAWYTGAPSTGTPASTSKNQETKDS